MTQPANEAHSIPGEGAVTGEAVLVPAYLTRYPGHSDRCLQDGCPAVAAEGQGKPEAAILSNLIHFGQIHQAALRLSCPEAARLALLSEDGLELEGLEIGFEPQALMEGSSGLSAEQWEEVRTEVFQVLLTQELELPRRLALLGLFCQRLTELLETGQGKNLNGLIQATDALVEGEALQIPLLPVTKRRELQAKFVGLFMHQVRSLPLTKAQSSVFDAVIAGLDFSREGLADPNKLNRRIALGQERLALALENKPWFFEHFLQNEMFREVFPWGEKTPLAHFARILRSFTVLQLLLIGRAAAQELPLEDAALVETVQVLCQVMESAGDLSASLGVRVTGIDWEHLGSLLVLV